MKLEFSRRFLEKQSSIKFNGNPSSATQVVPCGQTERWTYGQDMAELKVAFRKFMNAPKITSTGICILCHVIQSSRINHLITKSGNDCKSYAKKHEIEERLSTRQKGSCLFHLQKLLHKIIAANYVRI